ncbi:MAG: DMT family transporter [Roseibium sp.]|uniref:DMT family transporter n=1 Tax=Roseibium sp. TaxID=1936156 RepID=UPI001B1ED6D1|nr:DMT family transporter [Roseibium sp.]MBO6892846.1 DMT family transporter [Roseibium sp.]MBO6927947.1 DMT family transporter [Roseibium sp.]
MSLRNWIMLIVLGAIWGGSFLFAKVAVAEIPPFALVFLRVSSACAVLIAILWQQNLLGRLEKRFALSFLAMGLLNNAIPFSLLFLGQTVIGAGLASILNATTPIFTVIVASLLVKQETLQTHRIAGVLLGVVGVAVMLSSSLSGLATDPLWAQLCCLGAAVSYACAATFAHRFKSLPPQVSATGQLLGSSLIMLPVALFTSTGWSVSDPSIVAWLNVLALGVLATALAYLIYFKLLADAGATNASLVTLLVPASALFFGWLILDENLTATQLAGFAILLMGLVVLDGRILRRFQTAGNT